LYNHNEQKKENKMMTYKQRAVLRKQVLDNYQSHMSTLYRDWAREGISADEVRLQAMHILVSHAVEKTVIRLSRKTQKARLIREAAAIAELEFIKPIEPIEPVKEFKPTFDKKDELGIFD
jgi:hypothetical protein